MLTKVIEQAKIDHFTKWFERADRIVIVSHVSPDGDAIGSSLGLYHFLDSQEKTVNVIVPNAFPDFLKWMPGSKDIVLYDRYKEFADKLLAEADVICCLDFNALNLAKEYGCESVAFPLISSGIYGYPKDQALKVAIDIIGKFLLENEMTVFIVIFDRKAYQISGKLFADITAYIDDRYVKEHSDSREELRRRSEPLLGESCFGSAVERMEEKPSYKAISSRTLEDALNQIDESFSEMLLRKIDESDMTDTQCYKKANIDRKLFSKIRSNKFYKPSKTTVLAFALALELPIAEMQDMLGKAGFTLSRSSKFDIIVEYFVEQGNYNVYEINEALFAFDQSLIGS